MSVTLSYGIITFFISFLHAPVLFSLSPPIASTFPLSVISHVIAIFVGTFLFDIELISAVVSAIPALGPSFGTAPSGTCI